MLSTASPTPMGLRRLCVAGSHPKRIEEGAGVDARVSHNTAQLQVMARTLQSTDLDTTVVQKVRDLEIPPTAWPVLAAFGCASEYGHLREAAEEAAKGLDVVITALGHTVAGIATYYERMERRYGLDFDSADPRTRGTGKRLT
jgi:hypothetical protein